MATAVIMPKLGLTMTSGAVALWVADEGDAVSAGKTIVEVVTEKITYQVDAPEDGILLRIVVPEGDEVPVGTVIGVIGQQDEDVSEVLMGAGGETAGGMVASATSGDASPKDSSAYGGDETGAGREGRVTASPAARRRALELGVELAVLRGTGPGGRITVDDVDGAAGGAGGGLTAGAPAGRSADTLVPYAGTRMAIGERMRASWTTAPMVTHHVRADVHELRRFLAEINVGCAEGEGVNVTAAVVKAAARALRVFPRLNASLDGDTIRVWREVNVGVAVAVPDGLMVPVVKAADQKSLGEIAREVRSLARRAREGGLLPDDVSGGTFTVSNIGAYRSVDWFTPIINQPEAAILGVGRVVDSVVAVEGVPAVRPTMGLSLTFDHRVVDGAPAAEFLRALLDHLENPGSMGE